MLVECLDVSRIDVELVPKDKQAALLQISELLARPDGGHDAESILEVLSERERLASTGVGSGVAVPHGRIEGARSLRAAIGIFPVGVDFDAVDGLPVRIAVGILGPRSAARQHLALLAEVSRIMRRAPVREALLGARDANSAFDLVLSASSRQSPSSAV